MTYEERRKLEKLIQGKLEEAYDEVSELLDRIDDLDHVADVKDVKIETLESEVAVLEEAAEEETQRSV